MFHVVLAGAQVNRDLLLTVGGDLYEDLRRRGGKYEEAVTAAGVLKPCIEALMYLHSKVLRQIDCLISKLCNNKLHRCTIGAH